MSNRILSDDEDSLFGKSDDDQVQEKVEEPTVEDLFGEESEGEEPPVEQKQEDVVLEVNLPDLGGPKTNPDVLNIDVAFPAEITHVFEY
jgi:hypothetical protein